MKAKREEILRIAAEHGAQNVRIFGSVARGEADADSDVDILVDMEPGRSLLDRAALLLDLQRLLDILEAIERIQKYAARGREAFESVERILQGLEG